MQNLLVLFDPSGITAKNVDNLDEARLLALQFARQTNPGLNLFEGRENNNWWLMKDCERGLTTPKPWPVAGFLPVKTLHLMFGDELPSWIVFQATSDDDFQIVGCTSELAMLRELSCKGLGHSINHVSDKVTVTWHGTTIITAYAFQPERQLAGTSSI